MGSINSLDSYKNNTYDQILKTSPTLKKPKKYKSNENINRINEINILSKSPKTKTPQNDLETIFVFDWDDTLITTSYLMKNDIFTDNFLLTTKDKKLISKLEKQVYKILKQSLETGATYIITNSANGWVEWSAKNFYPSIIELLDKINIISARSLYEKKYPGNMNKWKKETFLNLRTDLTSATNIICIGDSEQEIEACEILSSKLNCISKTVKFKHEPKIDDLIRQLGILLDRFMYIVNSRKNLTIKFETES